MTMTDKELTVLHAYMGDANRYLEFGAGESTVYAANSDNFLSVESVESSKEFIDHLIDKNPLLSVAIEESKLTFHRVDIGETRSWGYPKNKKSRHLWPDYSHSVFNKPSEHDLVLIDGRFRMACALNSILRTPENCIIMIHDFWNRPEYQFILKFLDVREKVDTLGVFTKNKDRNISKIQSLLNKYQYLPGDKRPLERLKSRIRKKLKKNH